MGLYLPFNSQAEYCSMPTNQQGFLVLVTGHLAYLVHIFGLTLALKNKLPSDTYKLVFGNIFVAHIFTVVMSFENTLMINIFLGTLLGLTVVVLTVVVSVPIDNEQHNKDDGKERQNTGNTVTRGKMRVAATNQ